MESNQGGEQILSPQAWPACSSGAEGDESQAEKTQEKSPAAAAPAAAAAAVAAAMRTGLQQQTRALGAAAAADMCIGQQQQQQQQQTCALGWGEEPHTRTLTVHADVETLHVLLSQTGEMAIEDRVVGDVGD